MKKVGMIGYGRFGKILHELLSKKYEVIVCDNNEFKDDKVKFDNLENVLDCFLVFPKFGA